MSRSFAWRSAAGTSRDTKLCKLRVEGRQFDVAGGEAGVDGGEIGVASREGSLGGGQV